MASIRVMHVWLGRPDWFCHGTSFAHDGKIPEIAPLGETEILLANIIDHGKSQYVQWRFSEVGQLPIATWSDILLKSAPTLGECLAILGRAFEAQNPHLGFELERTRTTLSLICRPRYELGQVARFLGSLAMIIAYRRVIAYAFDDISDARIEFAGTREECGEGLLSNLRCQVTTGAPACRITMPAAWSRLKNQHSDDTLWQMALARLEYLEARGPGNDLANRVSRVIAEAIDRGDQIPTIDEMAEAGGVSRRTFTRMLAAEDLTYKQLVTEERKRKVIVLLQDSAVSQGEMAATLGFSGVPAFSRAFRDWFGAAPMAFRKKYLGDSR